LFLPANGSTSYIVQEILIMIFIALNCNNFKAYIRYGTFIFWWPMATDEGTQGQCIASMMFPVLGINLGIGIGYRCHPYHLIVFPLGAIGHRMSQA